MIGAPMKVIDRCFDRHAVGVTIGAVTVALGVVVPPGVAHSLSCVSRTEYHAVEDGWSKARVARVFDVTGRETAVRAPYRARTYDDCWRADAVIGRVSVIYRYNHGAWRVVDKTTQFWHP
jgi:hypothetical protein